MSQLYKFSAGGGGVPIETINGDTGSVTGSTVTIFANNVLNRAGSSVKFTNSATVSTLSLSDNSDNTLLGTLAGNLTLTGDENTGVGGNALRSLSSGTANTALGIDALMSVTTGNNNIGIGGASLDAITTGSSNIAIGGGQSLATSDSSNINIGNSGTGGDNNTIRIGTQGTGDGQQNKAVIAGIVGVTVSSAELVTINSSTGQLGVSPIVSQVSFSAYLSSPQSNVTGDGTIYTIPFDTALTNIGAGFNTGTGVFTAPITGNYQFNYTVTYDNTGLSTAFIDAFQGTNFNIRSNQSAAANVFSGTLISPGSIVLPMTAGDTMFVTAAAFGSTKTVEVFGMAPTGYATTTMFSGFLIK